MKPNTAAMPPRANSDIGHFSAQWFDTHQECDRGEDTFPSDWPTVPFLVPSASAWAPPWG